MRLMLVKRANLINRLMPELDDIRAQTNLSWRKSYEIHLNQES